MTLNIIKRKTKSAYRRVVLRVACMFTGISEFRCMLFDCLQYYLLFVDGGLCKRKFVLYFCFVGIFCTFCGPFY